MTTEFAERIRLAQDGDIGARNAVLVENLGLVRMVAGRFASRGLMPYDDALSAGTAGLFRAVQTFDPNRGTMFSTHAVRAIEGEMLSERRKGYQGDVTRERRIRRAEWIDSERADRGDHCGAMVRAEDVAKLRAVLDRWDANPVLARYAFIVRSAYGLDGSGPVGFVDIARTLNISRERTRILANRAFEWLCAEFGTETAGSLVNRRRPASLGG